jgi:hypothetical protein
VCPVNSSWGELLLSQLLESATRECGITFSGYGTLKLQAWCDLDYVGDLETRLSTTGYLFTLAGSLAFSLRWRPQP